MLYLRGCTSLVLLDDMSAHSVNIQFYMITIIVIISSSSIAFSHERSSSVIGCPVVTGKWKEIVPT